MKHTMKDSKDLKDLKDFMKRPVMVLYLLLALAVFVPALAEETSEPGGAVFVPQSVEALPTQTPEPTPEPTPAPATGESRIDFSVVQPDNPAASPIAVDPIDKPTPTPQPTPNYVYETYTSDSMGISFSIPYTWLLNPNTNQETTLQFVEPKSEMREPDGYQTRITIEKVNMGLNQTAADALANLESTLKELELRFTSFKANETATRSIKDANGYYCYYRAEYNDGTKDYSMRGRIIIVAKDKALYQVRITTPSAWYSYYENVFRKLCATLSFK